ncbi:MAG: EAL domain-containing protein [Cetobacterium sp.]|uniref:EAL domain-containing protein n=1 Tax=Cetobacterium sp. TaxID=2071632 RepID=UPI003F2E0C11
MKLISSNKDNSNYCIIFKLNILEDINMFFDWNEGDKIIKHFLDFFNQNKVLYKHEGSKFFLIEKKENMDSFIMKIKKEIYKLDLFRIYNLENSFKILYIKDSFSADYNSLFKQIKIIEEEIPSKRGIQIYDLNNNVYAVYYKKNIIKNLLLKNDISGLYAVFQPKFNLDDNSVIGAESLCRWYIKDFGNLSPVDFISIAEKIGKIDIIDFKIIEETFIFINYLLKNNYSLSKKLFSFNVSLCSLEKVDFIKRLNSLIKKYEIPTNLLEIEITETVLAIPNNSIINKLIALDHSGITISIDDFTMGNSSLRLLNLFPIKTIKLDKSILDLIESNYILGEIIYKNLINLFRDLNLNILSEGIETKNQLTFLINNNVKSGQGFIFSKPLLKDDFLKLFKVG